MLRKNQIPMKYALQLGSVPQFDFYEDAGGNRYPIPNGKYEVEYGNPQDFMASIAMSGGEAEAVEYGLSQMDYSAVLVIERNGVPLKEGALIWYQSEPQYKYGGDEVSVEIDGETISGKFPIKVSADFVVKKVSPSLNFEKILLEAVNK